MPTLRPVQRILVVDDERALADLVAEMLEIEGYAVERAYGGLQALEVLRSDKPPDLVLSDVMMPTLGGVELVDLARKRLHLPRLPFLLLSAGTVPRMRWSHVAFMPKPVEMDELLDRVGRLLQPSPARRRSRPHAPGAR